MVSPRPAIALVFDIYAEFTQWCTYKLIIVCIDKT